MIWVVVILAIAALVYLPGLWVRQVMRRYSEPGDRYPGSGGQFAAHLLQGLGMSHVAVESTAQGDHYDPVAKVVRLSPDNFEGRSLTAVTVAAHEVGHALVVEQLVVHEERRAQSAPGVTGGRLDGFALLNRTFDMWERIFYGEFDGRRRVLVKIIGE